MDDIKVLPDLVRREFCEAVTGSVTINPGDLKYRLALDTMPDRYVTPR
jgi:hypothetical protein